VAAAAGNQQRLYRLAGRTAPQRKKKGTKDGKSERFDGKTPEWTLIDGKK